jgi:hypothetical protein
MSRYIRCMYLMLCILLATISCDDEASEDCSGILCPFVGNWQLSEVTIDGSESDGDYSGYRLNLMAPEGGATSADYTRAYGDGQDESGSWTVANNNDVIVLTNDGEDEEYIVQESGSNKLVLVLHRESLKPGPAEVVYVFTK